jgi:hypothetical protein
MLVGIGLIAAADEAFEATDILLVPIAMGLGYALISGKRWMFTYSFMAVSLAAGVIGLVTVINPLLLDRPVSVPLLRGLVGTCAALGLLLLPVTRRFAGQERSVMATDPAITHLVDRERPWTIYVLTGLSIVGFVWSVVFDVDRTWWDIPLGSLTLFVTYSLWLGKQWALTLSRFLIAVCIFGAVPLGTYEFFVKDRWTASSWVWLVSSSAVWAYLLWHPATRRFAQLDEPRHPENAAI